MKIEIEGENSTITSASYELDLCGIPHLWVNTREKWIEHPSTGQDTTTNRTFHFWSGNSCDIVRMTPENDVEVEILGRNEFMTQCKDQFWFVFPKIKLNIGGDTNGD